MSRAMAPSTTERLYFDPDHSLEFRARVEAIVEHDGRPAVLLNRTAVT